MFIAETSLRAYIPRMTPTLWAQFVAANLAANIAFACLFYFFWRLSILEKAEPRKLPAWLWAMGAAPIAILTAGALLVTR